MNKKNFLINSLCFLLMLCLDSFDEEWAFTLSCPDVKTPVLLDNRFPPTSIWLGVHDSKEQIDYANKLIDIIQKNLHQLRVYIVTNDHVNGFSPTKNLRVLKIKYDIPIWIQDYFETLFDSASEKNIIADLPHFSDAILNIASEIASQLDMPLTEFPDSGFNNQTNNGNYGGNIEAFPGNIIAYGDSLSDDVLHYLQSQIDARYIALNVDWLEAGHVDEFLTHLPQFPFKRPCDFFLLRASPLLAFNLLKAESPIKYSNTFCKKIFSKLDESLHPDCQSFIQTNMDFELQIQENLENLLTLVQAQTGCKNIDVLNMPQLYIDGRSISYPVKAVALNSNIINLVSLGKHVFLSRQPYHEFTKYIKSNLKRRGLTPHFLLAEHLNTDAGGMHCNHQVARYCKQRK